MTRAQWIALFVIVTLFAGGTAVVMSVDPRIIKRLADAIELAEGAHVPGSVPNRLNNPGDLTVDLTGKSVGKEGIYVVYATYADGREALERQVSLMFTGSRIYNSGMTIYEMASHYTTTEIDAWALNVARYLGVDVNTRLNQLVA